MAEKTLAEMTEKQLRELIEQELKQVTRPLTRARLKLGVFEVEIEGSDDFVSQSISKYLTSPSAWQKVTSEQAEEYDFEKDGSVAIAPGTMDYEESVKDILRAEITSSGWTIKPE